MRFTGKALVFLFAAGIAVGCAKKEEKRQTPHNRQPARKEATIVVPPFVQGKWKAVKIAVTDKGAGKETVYTINLGGELTIPGSDLTIKVENFLPHFIMEGTLLTSQTNEPKNPAVQLRVFEKGNEIFKGWLFALFPTTHAFQHPKYGFTLVEYIPAK